MYLKGNVASKAGAALLVQTGRGRRRREGEIEKDKSEGEGEGERRKEESEGMVASGLVVPRRVRF